MIKNLSYNEIRFQYNQKTRVIEKLSHPTYFYVVEGEIGSEVPGVRETEVPFRTTYEALGPRRPTGRSETRSCVLGVCGD